MNEMVVITRNTAYAFNLETKEFDCTDHSKQEVVVMNYNTGWAKNKGVDSEKQRRTVRATT